MAFENALTKLLRKLEQINEDFEEDLKEDTQGVVVVLHPDGSGVLVAQNDTSDVLRVEAPLYRFANTDDLMRYLDATPMRRIMMSRAQR